MIFVDTSAIYAVLDRNDRNHEAAKREWFSLVDGGARMFTTNYVLVECCALAQSRLGAEAVRAIQEDMLPLIDLVWVDETIHAQAMAALLAARRRRLSLVDCCSFVAMRQRGAEAAFAFGGHFGEAGFVSPGDAQGSGPG